MSYNARGHKRAVKHSCNFTPFVNSVREQVVPLSTGVS